MNTLTKTVMGILDWLNQNAGLLSLGALLAAIIVPYKIYKKQDKDQIQSMKDELETINEVNRFPMSSDERNLYTRKFLLEKRLKRK